MKPGWRTRWLWVAVALVVLLPAAGVLYLRQSAENVMHPALDKLAAVPLAERWSHPEMLKIRELGPKAVPALRRVLREQDSSATHFLTWVKTKWPGATKHYTNFPDAKKMSERRWAACQALQVLGPAGRPAAPEIIAIFGSKDGRDLNGAAMALHAIGIDADICDRLDALMENDKKLSEGARMQVSYALRTVKPPTARTLKVLAAALSDPSPHVQYGIVESLGALGVRTPEIVAGLKVLQADPTNDMVVVSASAALWALDKDAGAVLPPVFRVLDKILAGPLERIPGGGNGGQGVGTNDQAFMAAAALFPTMNLGEADKARALTLLEAWGDKTKRIFIRMLLLPSMLELGYPGAKCLQVCDTGLSQKEDYYRVQAAGLLAKVAEKYPVNDAYLEQLLSDGDVGVRIYAAKAHWHQSRNAGKVVPVLVESLDRAKHQSYYYAQTQPVALETLGEIGPEAKEAVGALEKLAKDPNPAIAKLAAEALGKIRK